MDMISVEELSKAYKLKAEKENYENDTTVEVLAISRAVLKWMPLIGTEADKVTGGEFTRRCEIGIRELNWILKE